MTADPSLRHELLAMREAGQAVRLRPHVAGQHQDPGGVDARNAERLAEILAEQGWPSEDRAGRDGAQAAWLIAQHARHDPRFQRRCLELIRAHPRPGVEPSQLALLTDAIAVGEERPETYGTQGSLRVLDPERVDERRAAVGLGPLQAHLAQLQRWKRAPDGSLRRHAVIDGAWVEVPADYDPATVDGAGRLRARRAARKKFPADLPG